MAVRYSGDAEVRITWNRTMRTYEGTVTSPTFRFKGGFAPEWHRRGGPSRSSVMTSSESYDLAAQELLRLAERNARQRGRRLEAQKEGSRFVVRRGFQAPCPIRIR